MRSTLLAGLFCFVFALTPARAGVQQDVVYGRAGDVELKLDLAQPEGPGPFPAVICIHGGTWMSGSKSGYGPAMQLLAQSGYVGAAVDYRFAPTYKFPAQVDDVRKAIRYLRTHAAELKIDPDRLAVMGDSAGGQLALLLGLKDREAGVLAVINCYGPSDLTRWELATEGGKIEGMDADTALELVFGTKDRASSTLKQASPLYLIAKGAPPILTLHGDADVVVKLEQAEWLHAALRKAGVEEKLVVMKGVGHGFQGADMQAVIGAVVEFLGTHLKPAGRPQ
jgi:acetyl esterase/lipase